LYARRGAGSSSGFYCGAFFSILYIAAGISGWANGAALGLSKSKWWFKILS